MIRCSWSAGSAEIERQRCSDLRRHVPCRRRSVRSVDHATARSQLRRDESADAVQRGPGRKRGLQPAPERSRALAYGQYYTGRATGVGAVSLQREPCSLRVAFVAYIQALATGCEHCDRRTFHIDTDRIMSDLICRLHSTARRALSLTAIACASTTVCQSQTRSATTGVKEDKPGQLAMAHIAPDSARVLARNRIPGARIAAAEIEMEKGKLVYSFDMKTQGRRGIDEVLIDAMSGAIISVEHEGPAQEAAERARDARGPAARRDSTRRP